MITTRTARIVALLGIALCQSQQMMAAGSRLSLVIKGKEIFSLRLCSAASEQPAPRAMSLEESQLYAMWQDDRRAHGYRLPERYQDLYFYPLVKEDGSSAPGSFSRARLHEKVARVGFSGISALLFSFSTLLATTSSPLILASAGAGLLGGAKFGEYFAESRDIHQALLGYRNLAARGLRTLQNNDLPEVPHIKAAPEFCEAYDAIERQHKAVGSCVRSPEYLEDEYAEPVFKELKEEEKELHTILAAMLADPRMQSHPRLIEKVHSMKALNNDTDIPYIGTRSGSYYVYREIRQAFQEREHKEYFAQDQGKKSCFFK